MAMVSKNVIRYSCDFCRKTAYRRSTMAAHESGCTNNPDRVCKLCVRMGATQPTLEMLIESARNLEALRAVAHGCPACMLTGIRAYNREHDGEERLWLDYKAEHERYWREIGEREGEPEAEAIRVALAELTLKEAIANA
jgi:hypothetical protein